MERERRPARFQALDDERLSMAPQPGMDNRTSLACAYNFLSGGAHVPISPAGKPCGNRAAAG
jgi:hypothetical protein